MATDACASHTVVAGVASVTEMPPYSLGASDSELARLDLGPGLGHVAFQISELVGPPARCDSTAYEVPIRASEARRAS